MHSTFYLCNAWTQTLACMPVSPWTEAGLDIDVRRGRLSGRTAGRAAAVVTSRAALTQLFAVAEEIMEIITVATAAGRAEGTVLAWRVRTHQTCDKTDRQGRGRSAPP